MTRLIAIALLLILAPWRSVYAQSNETVNNATAASLAYLKQNAQQPNTIVLESGLQYRILTNGTGKVSPGIDTLCTVHYEGRLVNGTIFDSSLARGEPIELRPNQVIEGWQQALPLMVVGDSWELTIPSELAYGSRGNQGVIPGDAVLIMRVDLLDVALCLLCGQDGDLHNNDMRIPGTDNDTCETLNNRQIAADTAECNELQANRRACCQGQAVCSLCSDLSAPTLLDRRLYVPGVSLLEYCWQYWYASFFFDNSSSCLNALPVTDGPVGFDIAGYCGCANAGDDELTSPCGTSLCPDGLYEASGNTVSINFTCQDAIEVFPYFTDENQCTAFRTGLVDTCCSTEPPCTFCEDGAQVADPDLPVPYTGGFTCGNLVTSAGADCEICSQVNVLQNSTGDLRGYCSCENTLDDNDDTEQRTMCDSECPSGLVVNNTAIASDVTCSQLQNYLTFLYDSSELCQQATQEFTYSCCVVEPVVEVETAPCQICPINTTVTNLTGVLSIDMTCADIAVNGRRSNLNSEQCRSAQSLAPTVCQCRAVMENALVSTATKSDANDEAQANKDEQVVGEAETTDEGTTTADPTDDTDTSAESRDKTDATAATADVTSGCKLSSTLPTIFIGSIIASALLTLG